MKLRRNRPLLLIDIAVPRDIDPAVNFMENVFLYNIDDLQSLADDYLKQRKEEMGNAALSADIDRAYAEDGELLSSMARNILNHAALASEQGKRDIAGTQ